MQGAKLNKQARSGLMRAASLKRVHSDEEREISHKKENQIYHIHIHMEFMLI